jgi:hypothetical protein
MQPKEIYECLERTRAMLSQEINCLHGYGKTCAKQKALYKQKFYTTQNGYIKDDMSAAESKVRAEADNSELKRLAIYWEIMWSTQKDIVKARVAECNTLQTMLNASQEEWKQ